MGKTHLPWRLFIRLAVLNLVLLPIGIPQGLIPGECAQEKTSMTNNKDLPAPVLVPVPRQIKMLPGVYSLPPAPTLSMEGTSEETCEQLGKHWFEVFPPESPSPSAKLSLKPGEVPHPQGYILEIGKRGVRIIGHDEAGLFYGMMTLCQILRQYSLSGELPFLRIEDWPDFPNRGVLLDISRDKVPEMETLYTLVDQLAEMKYNQVQLYTEHTFAYRDHPIVWQDASPMTPVQIRNLDAFCRERYIDLVPNQNSFGHRERWLKFPEYRHLAEMPEGGMDLCAVDPASVEHLKGLYADLLPNFSSDFFNVGCDETWSLGKGRSKAEVDARGVGRVYLEFLLKIHDLVTAQGRKMMFWGDIIMQHPELIPELPKDLIALEWGYEADHPFAEHGRKFADSGIPFYVCPGTSSWNTLVGRTDNAVKNLLNAAENGLANGSIGYLVTDWGDGGHWQFLPISYVGYAYGAAVSWCLESNRNIHIPQVLDVHLFQDRSGVMGRLAWDLGNAYQQTGVLLGNNTLFYCLLQHHISGGFAGTIYEGMKKENLEETLAYVDKVMSSLPQAEMYCPDAELIVREFTMAAAMVKLSCRLGLARLEAGGVGTESLPEESKTRLATELEGLLPEYRQIWLERNRSGGLKDSVGKLETLLGVLKKQ